MPELVSSQWVLQEIRELIGIRAYVQTNMSIHGARPQRAAVNFVDLTANTSKDIVSVDPLHKVGRFHRSSEMLDNLHRTDRSPTVVLPGTLRL
jgi:hypothetical protein